MSFRYVHTSIVARDWRSLSRFYEEVLGCERVPPTRQYSGPELAAGTRLPNAHLEGVHLRLPGHGHNGPTLEIFQYSEPAPGDAKAVNSLGFAHIAFHVDDVRQARTQVLAGGGAAVGQVVTLTRADGNRVTWCYVRDPEGNVVELQSWRGPAGD